VILLYRFRLLEGETIEFTVFGLRDNVAQLLVFEVPYFYLCFQNSRNRQWVLGTLNKKAPCVVKLHQLY